MTNYFDSAIDGAIASLAPYVIGDRFQTDGVLTGRAADNGGSWATTGTAPVVTAGKVAMGAAAGYASIPFAIEGTVGVRYSTLPGTTARVGLEMLSDRPGASSKRIEVSYDLGIWRLRAYNTAWIVYASAYPIDVGNDGYDDTEIIMNVTGKIVTVWINGRKAMSATMGQTEYDAMKTQTKACFQLIDSNSRVDRFFAHT
jgi:hypothetical protein